MLTTLHGFCVKYWDNVGMHLSLQTLLGPLGGGCLAACVQWHGHREPHGLDSPTDSIAVNAPMQLLFCDAMVCESGWCVCVCVHVARSDLASLCRGAVLSPLNPIAASCTVAELSTWHVNNPRYKCIGL
jgi:hypothetical protein